MNNYYFTADKWYGPYNGESGYKVFLLPSGPSSIPEFAGMVKEEGKDFKWKYQCPACGGDGKETCNNPDHNFIQAALREIGRLGCPVCGHDPDHKVNGGKNVCPECGGYGLVIPEVFEEYGREYGYDEEPIQTAVPVAEEGKQTFSESDMIGFAEWIVDERYIRSEYRLGKWYQKPFSENAKYYTTNDLLTEYLKSKQ